MTAPLAPGQAAAIKRCLGTPWTAEMNQIFDRGVAECWTDRAIAWEIERATGRPMTAHAVQSRRLDRMIPAPSRGGPLARQQRPVDPTALLARPKTCQYIAGDPRIDATMCGAKATRGPYCDEHGALCYRVDDGQG